MGKYQVVLKPTAIAHLKEHKLAGNKSTLDKIQKIIFELEDHPYTGSGKPEQLKHELKGFWSRRINQKDRMIYQVEEHQVTVIILTAKGHYFDK